MMEGALLELDGVRKSFDSTQILKGISLSIARAEFLTFLGPSGCGKTTTLRIIAGFEKPDAGRVLLRGRDVTGLPPYARDVHTVFQHYALFPHYDVFDNVAFGLRIQKLPESEIKERVASALALVKLGGFERRRTTNLSGGQMQRIALARALVGRPSLLLLDEPLGALDLKLRKEMQLELKAIQRRLGIAFIYVTHDQEEAMTMSDRIAVFNQGRIEQLGAPAEIYEHPRTGFVADFIGSANVFSARLIDSSGGRLKLRLEDELDVELSGASSSTAVGELLEVAIRPERVCVHYDQPPAPVNGTVRLSAALKESVYLGNSSQVYLSPFSKSGKTLLSVSLGVHPQEGRRPAGSPVWADIKPRDILLLEPKSHD
jgi:spermidine/putrescine transport system ATP-binding protein